MAPVVTEVAYLYPEAGRQADTDAVWPEFTKLVLQQPGARNAYTSVVLDQGNTLNYLFVDWDSVAAHTDFTKTEDFGPAVQKLFDTLRTPARLHHVEFSPDSAVLHNEGGKSAVAELLNIYFPAGDAFTVDQMNSVVKSVGDFLAGLPGNAEGHTGEVASGWVIEEVEFKGEKTRMYMVAIG